MKINCVQTLDPNSYPNSGQIVVELRVELEVFNTLFRRLSLFARVGFRATALKFSKVGVEASGLALLRLATVSVSGLSPCNILTLTMLISSLARVFERSSMNCCASANFSDSSS